MNLCVKVGARGSPLSQKQTQEVLKEINAYHPHITFEPTWITTKGDKDKKTSLRHMENSDFFTKEIDEMQLAGDFRISIHSAKDLPDPLQKGLLIVALTKGLDPSDALVQADTFTGEGKIATSSLRRAEAVKALYPEAQIVDIRGNIEERLGYIERGEIEGLVVAECALIRLGLTHLKRKVIEGATARYQGQLAIIARYDDTEMKTLFSSIDSRKGTCCAHSM